MRIKAKISIYFSLFLFSCMSNFTFIICLWQNRVLVLFTVNYCNITNIIKDHSTINPEELIKHSLLGFNLFGHYSVFSLVFPKIIFSFCSMKQSYHWENEDTL